MKTQQQISEILTRPFPREVQEQKPGPGGRRLTYVAWSHYARRLNEAYGVGAWGFRVLRELVESKQAAVLVRLVVPCVDETGRQAVEIESWGACEPQRGEIRDLGDALKSAQSDALKGAARQLGLGLDLYSEAERVEAPKRKDGSGSPATESQLRAIQKVSSKLKIPAETVTKSTQKLYGCRPSQLTKRQAQEVIDRLHDKLQEKSKEERTMATDRQLSMIRATCKKLGHTEGVMHRYVSEVLNRTVDDIREIEKQEASDVIESLLTFQESAA